MQTLTPQQRNAKAKGFQKKLEDFQKFVEKAQKELETREAELLGKLYRSIEKSANDYGKANGYAAIVAKKELLYVGENANVKDITDEITRMVNTEQQKK
jgi:outer membrane protein